MSEALAPKPKRASPQGTSCKNVLASIDKRAICASDLIVNAARCVGVKRTISRHCVLLTAITLLALLIIAPRTLADQQTALAEPTPTPKSQLIAANATATQGETSDELSVKDYLKSVDETLDASLAATLAGLALAAAAFLLPVEQKKLAELKDSHKLTLEEVRELLASSKTEDRVKLIKKIDELKRKVTSDEDKARLREFGEIDKAIKLLVWSFFFFTAALIDCILVDPLSNLSGELGPKAVADLAVSGGGTITGIAFMFRSALLIRRMLSPGKIVGEESSDRNGDTAEAPSKPET